MTEVAVALNKFFGGFGVPAWPIGGVPTYVYDAEGNAVKVEPPYISYQLVRPRWDAAMPFYAEVWVRSTIYAGINAIVDAIEDAIGGGVSLPAGDGAVYIHKGDQFCQMRDMAGDPTLKCAYLSMTIQAIT